MYLLSTKLLVGFSFFFFLFNIWLQGYMDLSIFVVVFFFSYYHCKSVKYIMLIFLPLSTILDTFCRSTQLHQVSLVHGFQLCLPFVSSLIFSSLLRFASDALLSSLNDYFMWSVVAPNSLIRINIGSTWIYFWPRVYIIVFCHTISLSWPVTSLCSCTMKPGWDLLSSVSSQSEFMHFTGSFMPIL